MLRALSSSLPDIRDSFIRVLSLQKIEENEIATMYRKWEWIFLALKMPLSLDIVEWMAATYLPERAYFPYFGYSIDMVHEIGDVIVPNVFLPYDTSLSHAEITKENRDTLVRNPRFLDTFSEQKDYYVEDYGLSVWGIIVDEAPIDPSDDLMGKMMLAYEWDIYVSENSTIALDAVIDDQVPSLILAGIVRGKAHPKHEGMNPYDLVAKNIITTIRLMEEE